MNPGIVGQAAGLFAVTNVDDIVVLALFYARGSGRPGGAAQVVAGQYAGFTAILVLAVAAAFGATFLPEPVLPYLGLLPLALGVKAAWQAWLEHRGAGSRPRLTAPSLVLGPPPVRQRTACHRTWPLPRSPRRLRRSPCPGRRTGSPGCGRSSPPG
ncbi:hypothetical protein Sme01_46830 [Sphaerisporangium melleum]|uniref:Cadmium resistance transporter n=1 Tax=Sphaerisporangium melleum TaxID=321316 RepID=A0A917VPR3_9ACTN|nr:cadmium resistance transporter [Sphaerisporangium melleum]GGL02083.1 hypothetical protein GCM10007964_50240 [Sphaerisporangium melleum]GII72207.1 hypothetical protein Sme01_46830 [Sphaerisporangium melleum]